MISSEPQFFKKDDFMILYDNSKLLMNQDKDRAIWLAAHIYCGQPWERFLSEAVKPLIEEVMNKRWASQFFFIRYWERGPHIRLRLKVGSEVSEDVLRIHLADYFTAYFEKNSSERVEPKWVMALPEDQQWYPNDSVQFITYDPEINRYGGPEAIKIAERQFCISADVALSVINEELKDWNYDRALGAAIQKHLGFAYATFMDVHEAAHFFKLVFRSWFPRAYNTFDKTISKAELASRSDLALKAFEGNFQNQKEMLLPYFETVWQALEKRQSFNSFWMNAWIKNMTSVAEQLMKLQSEKKLIIPCRFQFNSKLTEPVEKQERWAIYLSYIHMINNRLGILNHDEGYVGYLMSKCFELLCAKSAPMEKLAYKRS